MTNNSQGSSCVENRKELIGQHSRRKGPGKRARDYNTENEVSRNGAYIGKRKYS